MKTFFYYLIDNLDKVISIILVLGCFSAVGYVIYKDSQPREDIAIGVCVQYRPLSQIYKIESIVNGYALLMVVKEDQKGDYMLGYQLEKKAYKIKSAVVDCPK